MKRTATAHWKGDGMSGTGSLSTQSGALKEQPYSFKTRFGSEDGKAGTNPEELLGAAHAGCFSMALSFMLSENKFAVDDIMTTASVEVQNKNGGFEIVEIVLNLKAKIPGITQEKFQELSAAAKAGCPLSKALASTKITLVSELMN
ncbi:MAG: OsmC family protein [Rhizobacter sp.]|nr:OsmC family protein [Bacteriovorax sp.]